MQYVYGKVLECRKQNFSPFAKITKNDLFTDQKQNMIFLTFLSFSYFCLSWGQFLLFLKMDKKAISYISRPFHRHITCKNWTIIVDLEKMHIVAEKVLFPSFFTHAVGEIWSKLIKCMCNSIFYHNLTFKIHRFQRYSL